MSEKHFLYILAGLLTTMSYTIAAVLFGCMIAVPVAVMRMSERDWLRQIGTFYISIIRGTPLVLQLSIWYFAFPRITGLQIPAFIAGVITFSINSSAYLAEIIRAGINAVDVGQKEAAKILGINDRDTFFDIILPQALKNISPAILNEIVSLTKETAIIGYIGITDLARRAQLVSAETYNFFAPMLAAGAGYYLLTLGIVKLYNVFSPKH